MKKIKMNREGDNLFIKISGVTESEAEIIGKMLGITADVIPGIQTRPDSEEKIEEDALKLAQEMKAAGVDVPPADESLEIPEEAAPEETVPEEAAPEEAKDEGLAKILEIAASNKKIAAMGLEAFIKAAAPYTEETVKKFGITNLDVFLARGEKKQKSDLGNRIVNELRSRIKN